MAVYSFQERYQINRLKGKFPAVHNMIYFLMAVQGITRIAKHFLIFSYQKDFAKPVEWYFLPRHGKRPWDGIWWNSRESEREAAKASLQRPENIQIYLRFQLYK